MGKSRAPDALQTPPQLIEFLEERILVLDPLARISWRKTLWRSVLNGRAHELERPKWIRPQLFEYRSHGHIYCLPSEECTVCDMISINFVRSAMFTNALFVGPFEESFSATYSVMISMVCDFTDMSRVLPVRLLPSFSRKRRPGSGV